MARTRSVKPEFWDDEKLATVSRDARLTFIGLWTNSDDYGVVKGHPSWLKNTIYPYDDIRLADFQKWLKELESLCCIVPFSSNGEKYYYIKHFLKHQTINHPSKRINPEPPSTFSSTLPEPSGSPIVTLPFETETETETETEKRKDSSPQKEKYLDSVFLSAPEYKKLQEVLGQKSLDIGIEKLDYSITVKGGKYKDHYKTLLNWFRRGYLAEKENGFQANRERTAVIL